MLHRINNLIKRYRQSHNAQNVKKDSDKYILAWVPCKFPPPGSKYIRTDNPCFQRMINPLADADQKNAGKQNEGMYVCDALHIENQSGDCPGRPQHYEYVIPVLYLQPGEKFVQFDKDPSKPDETCSNGKFIQAK